MKLENLKKNYLLLAIIILNASLLFLLVNLAIWVTLEIRINLLDVRNGEDASTPDVVKHYGIEKLRTVYPDLDDDNILQLLKESWIPFEYELFTVFREAPRTGKYVNVSPNGFRYIEDQGSWPIDSAAYNIFIFGGSTAFGYGAMDSNTIASYLQKKLTGAFADKEIRVYNFGQGAYYSTQERILFENLLARGIRPDHVIFIDGLNDSVAGGIGEARSQLLRNTIIQGENTEGNSFIADIPIMRVVNNIRWRMNVARNPSAGEVTLHEEIGYIRDEKYNQLHSDVVIRNYFANKTMIESISERFGIKSLFVWQPIPHYHYDLELHGLIETEFATQHFAPYLYKKMDEMLKNTVMDRNFLWLADMQENATEMYYVDSVHYNPLLSAQIADAIADRIKDTLSNKEHE